MFLEHKYCITTIENDCDKHVFGTYFVFQKNKISFTFPEMITKLLEKFNKYYSVGKRINLILKDTCEYSSAKITVKNYIVMMCSKDM